MFFFNDIISCIVISTNAKIKPKVDLVENNDTFYYIKCTDSDKVKDFIGLCYTRAVLGMNHHYRQLLFSDITGPPIFSTTMSANKFKFIHGNICFDGMSTGKTGGRMISLLQFEKYLKFSTRIVDLQWIQAIISLWTKRYILAVINCFQAV